MLPLLGATSITLRRYTGGHVNSDGRFDQGTATDSSILASVQSANDEDLELLPEGFRRSQAKRVYTATALHTASQYTAAAADRLVIGGEVYQVQVANTYPAILPHGRYVATRLQEGQS